MPTRRVLRPLKRCLLLTATLLGCWSAGVRADYTIQIGAFRNPTDQYAADARRAGPVYLTERAGGIMALSAGRFENRADAESTLNELKEYYPDAFVAELSPRALAFATARELASDLGGATTSSTAGGASIPKSNLERASSPAANSGARPAPSISEQRLLDRLTDDERRRVVYLDGVLHVKSGNDFIPLTEY